MDEKELDLSKVNEIDMECSVCDDDDGFGGFVANTPKSTHTAQDSNKQKGFTFFNDDEQPQPPCAPAANDGREVVSKTGIILNFGDDEVNINPKEIESDEVEEIVAKPITAKMTDDGFVIDNPNQVPEDFSGYNQIDMECAGPDDSDDDFGEKISNSGGFLDFGDDEDEIEKELVNEQIVEESKEKAKAQLSQGDVENDYYEKLKKKHAATNVKGAYNTHFHFSGNPKAEAEIFNSDMTPAGPIPNMVTATAEASGEACAMGESLNPSYKKLFEDLLLITGCELNKNDNGKYCLKDIYGTTDDRECCSINDITDFLNPYVEDCFIIPLQIETGNNFKTCKEWTDWYTPEMEKKYPQCKKDIAYCDVYANHLPECKLF